MPTDATIRFDPELPISARVDDIEAALRQHQVLIVAGETGSGKTTQLPKICLRAGRTRIGHTQPRRIAARSVAERIAEELRVPLGDLVGYQVRFTRKASVDTQLKVMTDGVLLNEIGFDRDLRRYDTIIVDEAHERSLNIDFLLGYLKQLLPRRPELKVIVTSATIDTARFSAHFDDAPIVEVSGRTFPVEVRYRPLLPDADDEAGSSARAEPRDQVEAICDAATELLREGDGDILVFLAGEREIRDTADALADLLASGHALPRALSAAVEVLPLYARLSAAEQHRVFARHTGRRIVLATNVAETSLTVPGIRYVIDPGTARISRYSARTKVQRLPIEPVSQASANQRAGRCGRVAPGICLRLYSEEDFLGRPEFTEPEILRTNLASVILQMAAAGLGKIAQFPFVEAPDTARITDGLRLLDELGALAGGKHHGQGRRAARRRGRDDRRGPQLTKIGRQLARIPVDPRMGRMLIEAERLGCLREVMIIVAALSIQDPRERPTEQRDKADALHRRFWAPLPDGGTPPGEQGAAARAGHGRRNDGEPTPDGSDFIAWLRLWTYVRQQRKALSGNGFRRMCRDEFLHFLRLREWQDLHTQLRQIGKELGWTRNSAPADHDAVHTAILSGLLSQIGLADLKAEEQQARRVARGRGGRRRRPMREYLGARGTRFAINPGSSVAKTQPELVMAAEIVETTRMWARTVAGIRAEWVEQVGAHLLTRSYSEPHWSAKTGSVVALERVSLYGVPIIAGRRVNYGRIEPAEARALFIRRALVEGEWRTRHAFFHHNADVRERAEQLEERSRRRDLMVDDEALIAFYDARIPADVVSVGHFDSWWHRQREQTPHLLDLTLEDLIPDHADAVDPDAFPDELRLPATDGADVIVPVTYVFDPGSGSDGVRVTLPIEQVNRVVAAPLTWQVPGLRPELAVELLRSLPKRLRTQLVPVPDHARRALDWLAQHPGPTGETLCEALARALQSLTGVIIPADAWDLEHVPDRLRIGVAVSDGTSVVAEGKDLDEVRSGLTAQVTRSLNRAATALRRTGATEWVFGDIPERVELGQGPAAAIGYPALTDEGGTVGLTVADRPERQAATHRAGLRRLVLLTTPDPTRWVVAHLSAADKLALGVSPYASVPDLLADARLAAAGDLVARHAEPGTVRAEDAFARLRDLVRQDLPMRTREVVAQAAQILRADQQARHDIDRLPPDSEIRADVTEQRANLVFAGFLAATGADHRGDLVRYLTAISRRASEWGTHRARDDAGAEVMAELESRYAELCAAVPPGPLPEALVEIGWQLEELRVSLFAQSLGTRAPVSAKRVRRALAAAA